MTSDSRMIRLGLGLIVGAVIAAVDSFAFGGEVSPIVIVVLLLAACAGATSIWGRRGALAVAAVWICLPLVHLIKHMLGLPDTLHPDTYRSVLMLAAFTFVVSVIGAGGGFLLFKSTREP